MNIRKTLSIMLMALLVFFGLFSVNFFVDEAKAAEDTTVVFHYNRGDGDYTSWNVYYWYDGGSGYVNFTENDSFGKVAIINVNKSINNLGFIVRKSTSYNEWEAKDTDEDRFITSFSNGKAEVWINSGQKEFKTQAPSGHSSFDVAGSSSVTLNIHYYRYADDYTDWSIWAWPKNGDGNDNSFCASDSYGVMTSFRVPKTIKELGFVIKKGDWAEREVGGDRYIDMTKASNGILDVWILQNDEKIYYNSSSVDKSQKIMSASISSFDRILLKLSKPMNISGASALNSFTVKDSSGKNYSIKQLSSTDSSTTTSNVMLVMNENLDISKSYTVYSTEYKEQKTSLGAIYSTSAFESAYTYTGNDLGATWTKSATTFKVWAPVASEVVLNLYKNGTNGSAYQTVSMTKGSKGVWEAKVTGDLNKVYYTYSITNNGTKKETVDLYARTTGVNGKRGMVINLTSTNPTGWESDENPFTGKNITDASVYELHVRDYTIDNSSGVKNKGKFLGLTEKGTRNSNGQITGLDYIASLGVTHVQILPMYDYSPNSVDETKLSTPQFNWGYDPYNYNAPEGSYSLDPYNGEVRVNELKQMVQAFHNEGIAVVMDVVYNHTAETANSYFNITVPDYYHRQNADGTFSNGSGCGNEVASERAMARKYIIESVVYWAKEYHIDGFRFDLMGLLDMETMNQLRSELNKIDPSILLYGEGWTGGSSPLSESLRAVKSQTHLMNGVGAFSDDIRDGVRGNNFDAKQTGYVSGASGLEERIKAGVVGATKHNGVDYYKSGTGVWTNSPIQAINYVSCHDNMTLWDKINSSNASDSLSDRVKMNKLSASIIFTSQGVPFLLSGEEILRTKPAEGGGFDHNSYKSSDYTNSVKWDTISNKTYQDSLEYYKGLIAFRNAHSGLRMTKTSDIQNNLKFLNTGKANVVGFTINNKPNGEVSDSICVIYNPNKEAVTVTVPYGKWQVCIKDGKAGTSALETFTGTQVTVAPISCLAMVQGTLVPDTSFALPDVKGMDVNAAVSLLEGGKYRLDVDIEWQTSDTVDANKVISTNPKNGSKVNKNDKITIYASLGKKIEKVSVPNLKNLTEAEAKAKLIELGLTPVIKYEYNDDLKAGIVLSQSYSSGTSLAKGSEVEIIINKVHDVVVDDPIEVETTTKGSSTETTTKDNKPTVDNDETTSSDSNRPTDGDEETTTGDDKPPVDNDETTRDEDKPSIDETTNEDSSSKEDETTNEAGSSDEEDVTTSSTGSNNNGGSGNNNKNNDDSSGIPGWVIIFIVFVILCGGGLALEYFVLRKRRR